MYQLHYLLIVNKIILKPGDSIYTSIPVPPIVNAIKTYYIQVTHNMLYGYFYLPPNECVTKNVCKESQLSAFLRKPSSNLLRYLGP